MKIAPNLIPSIINAFNEPNPYKTVASFFECQQHCKALDEIAIVTETDASGTIIRVNQKTCQLSGFPAHELLGANHRILSSGLHTPEFYSDLWNTIDNNHIWQGEICNRSKTGDLYWVNTTIVPISGDQNQSPYKYLSICFDITQQKCNELNPAKLQVNENSCPPFFLIKNNNFLDCNLVALSALGYQYKDDLINRNMLDISPKIQADGCLSSEKLIEIYRIALENGQHYFDWTYCHSDGSCFKMEVKLAVIHLGNDYIFHKQWQKKSVRQQLEFSLYTEQQRASVILASINEAVITTDNQGIITALNLEAAKLTGWDAETSVGKNITDIFQIINIPNRELTYNPVTEVLFNEHVTQPTCKSLLISKDGTEYNIENSAAPIQLKDGALQGCVLVFRAISKQYPLSKETHWQTGYDVLTRLPNRSLLAHRFAQSLQKTNKIKGLLCVCMMDLDDFKPINDIHGHALGDQLLVAVTSRIMSVIRREDTLARLGGDEFALLISNLNDISELKIFLERILSSISTPYIIEGKTINISTSIGITIYPNDNVDADTLLRHADQAMYQAKQSGRNCYHIFDVEHDQFTQNSHQTRERVRQALKSNELRLHYQPKVNMRSHQVIGVEALLRWQHPEQGLVPPLDFLPLIEQSDLIIDIGEWVIDQALMQISTWVQQENFLVVSVNIAAHHFQHPDFLARLTNILSKHPTVPPCLLEIEILESVALGDLEHIRQLINACQALGVSFSLDDFGTGYSSLSYLKRLPANTIKVDQSFVRDMLDNKEDFAVIEAVISLANVFDRKVIAEGVESTEHGLLLMRLGCDLAQGYGIARPMHPNEIPNWIKQFTPDPNWILWANVNWALNDFPLLVAQHDHQNWMKILHNALEGKPTKDEFVALNDQPTTRFNQWYTGHGKLNYKHLPEFSTIAPIHQEIQALGNKIITLCQAGDFSLARTLSPNLEYLNNQIIKQLIDLQKKVANIGLETANTA